jgi:hypothetical protein
MTYELDPKELETLRARLAEQDTALAEVDEAVRRHPDVAFDIDPQAFAVLESEFDVAPTLRAPTPPRGALVRG